MYAAGTVLTLKDPHPNDPETDEVFAYNEVSVIGASVISRPGTEEWSGTANQGVMLMPTANFGGVIDEPLGKIQALYSVKSVPELTVPTGPTVIPTYDSRSSAAGPTPEEVFADQAPGEAAEKGQNRARTPMSPLVDPRPKASDGPLGPVPKAKK